MSLPLPAKDFFDPDFMQQTAALKETAASLAANGLESVAFAYVDINNPKVTSPHSVA
jgi:hypothetical protein